MKTLVVIVHVAAAAVVLGGSLGWGRFLRQAAEGGQVAARVAAADVMRRMMLVRIGSAMTLFTGIGLIFLSGGFAVVPKNFHIALTLMLAALGWVLLGVVPRVKRAFGIASAVEFDPKAFAAAAGKVGMSTGIVHALWLVILVLMFVMI